MVLVIVSFLLCLIVLFVEVYLVFSFVRVCLRCWVLFLSFLIIRVRVWLGFWDGCMVVFLGRVWFVIGMG